CGIRPYCTNPCSAMQPLKVLLDAIAPAIQSRPAITCVSLARPLQIALALSKRLSFVVALTSRHCPDDVVLLHPTSAKPSAAMNMDRIHPSRFGAACWKLKMRAMGRSVAIPMAGANGVLKMWEHGAQRSALIGAYEE
ncbi:hypothetical protein, partial [Mesorhizobium sp. M4B.F.Ca.ET.089.01.1.1]|uniref:hypothetical protein n=1 Tax=Mesorhizobium sp. M4B.F.Ca.ET.089.01.1.1 TaxID=2496662 RepID=UPI001AECEAF8